MSWKSHICVQNSDIIILCFKLFLLVKSFALLCADTIFYLFQIFYISSLQLDAHKIVDLNVCDCFLGSQGTMHTYKRKLNYNVHSELFTLSQKLHISVCFHMLTDLCMMCAWAADSHMKYLGYSEGVLCIAFGSLCFQLSFIYSWVKIHISQHVVQSPKLEETLRELKLAYVNAHCPQTVPWDSHKNNTVLWLGKKIYLLNVAEDFKLLQKYIESLEALDFCQIIKAHSKFRWNSHSPHWWMLAFMKFVT